MPIYVIGRQSLFGYSTPHLLYIDPVTKDHYWPTIRRGPETADVETLQWDGLHDRWDEQPSGFAPYELARLAKDTGGIYFLLPERGEHAGPPAREGVLDRDAQGVRPRLREPRRIHGRAEPVRPPPDAYEIITDDQRTSRYRRHFPILPAEMIARANEEAIQGHRAAEHPDRHPEAAEALKKLRDREPEKRGSALRPDARPDRRLPDQGLRVPRLPRGDESSPSRAQARCPTPELIVEWVLDHSPDRRRPRKRPPRSTPRPTRSSRRSSPPPQDPWSDLAQDEWTAASASAGAKHTHTPYTGPSRAKFVPKF